MERNISLYDLMQDEEVKTLIETNNEEGFKKVLWDLGFDTKQQMYYRSCYHHPKTYPTNENWYGARVEGVERSDQDWIDSGHQTQDARMEGYRRSDPELYKDLKRMSHQSNPTADFIEKLKGRKGEEDN